jgi:hypothetical protein
LALLDSFPLNYVHVSCSVDIFDVLVQQIFENAMADGEDNADRGV